MPFEIVRNDIAKMQVDAIVCSGNRRLEKTSGVCGAVFSAAGPELEEYCRQLPVCDTGAAIVTPGFNLPAQYIIHTVGPHWNGGQYGEEEILRTCYRNVLRAAANRKCKSVAVPMIATGKYRFPPELALTIAKEEIKAFLKTHGKMRVFLVVFGPQTTRIVKEYQDGLQEFMTNEEYRARMVSAAGRSSRRRGRAEEPSVPKSLGEAAGIENPGFREILRSYVAASGYKWSTIYHTAGVGKTVASKIMTKPNYNPSKQTALAFAIGLCLSLKQTEHLLNSFGASLSPASKADNIVKYFILKGDYDIDAINEALIEYGEKPFPNNNDF